MKIQFNFVKTALIISAATVIFGCQKMDSPKLGDYPKDANLPNGPLKFYVNFDLDTTDPLKFAVDNIRANFPQVNTTNAIAGITGKAMQGEGLKHIVYAKPNDWISTSESFTVAFWFKLNGQTKNNKGGNGPEYIFSVPSSNGHWSDGQAMLFFETNSTGTQIKFPVVDKTTADTWFTWEGGNAIPGIADNTWRHCALVYDATTSKMTLYLNGVANTYTPTWANHGKINMDNTTASAFRLGAGPKAVNTDDADDWLRSTWKGGLDQFRLYSTALTPAEVMDLFTNKK